MTIPGPEFVQRWFFGETQSWGITVQIGIGKILSVDPDFKRDILKEIDADKLPPVILTYGIGISF